jgi:hypothetical protein
MDVMTEASFVKLVGDVPVTTAEGENYGAIREYVSEAHIAAQLRFVLLTVEELWTECPQAMKEALVYSMVVGHCSGWIVGRYGKE